MPWCGEGTGIGCPATLSYGSGSQARSCAGGELWVTLEPMAPGLRLALERRYNATSCWPSSSELPDLGCL